MASPENICVGCESPLVRGQRYGIRRGQLWHSHCFVAFGGKTGRERDLERRVASLETRLASESAAHANMREQREEQRTRAITAENECDIARARLKTANQIRDSLRKELIAVRDINTMSRNDLDRVQRELAELQRAVAAPPPATPAADEKKPETKPENDDYTGTETRFSLLELD